MKNLYIVKNSHQLLIAYAMAERNINIGFDCTIIAYGYANDLKLFDNRICLKTIPQIMIRRRGLDEVIFDYKTIKELYKNVKDWLKLDNSEERSAYFFTDQQIELQIAQAEIKRKCPRCSVFLVEEGMTLYSKKLSEEPKSTVIGNKISWLRIKSNTRRYIYIFIGKCFGLKHYKRVQTGESKWIDGIVCYNANMLRDNILYDRKIVVQPFDLINANVINSFLEKISSFDKSLAKRYKCDYLYLGAPFSESGMVSIEQEILFIINIFKMLPQNKKILIKPHPSESPDKYSKLKKYHLNISIDLDYAKYPIECFYSFLKSPVILSVLSSAMPELMRIYKNTRAYALYMIGPFYDYQINVNKDVLVNTGVIVPISTQEFKKMIINTLKEEKLDEKAT